MNNKILKRILGVTVVAFSLFLAACGNGEGGANGDVTLTYSIWDSVQEPGMQAAADVFNERNDDIHVNVEVTPWDQYWTKLESSAQGENLPDIFWMHSNEIAKYSEGNVLYDLTEAIETGDVDLANYPAELNELYEVDGKILGVPKDYGTIGLWYNKEIFDEAGLDYPNETWTWDDLLENAIELTDEENDVYGFLAPLNREEGYHNFIYQNGGQVLSDDKSQSGFRSPETVEAVQWYADLSTVHGVSPDSGAFAENAPLSYFQSGRAAMLFQGSWMTGEIANNEYSNKVADVTVLPAGNERASIFNGLANSVSATTNHPEEAIRFLEFLSSEEGMALQGQEGGAIPAYAGADSSFIEAYPQFNTQAFLDMMDYGVIKPYSRYTTRWENVENNALIPVFNGEATVEEVADQLVTEIEAVLESE